MSSFIFITIGILTLIACIFYFFLKNKKNQKKTKNKDIYPLW